MFGFSAVNNQSNGTFGYSHVTGIVSDYSFAYVNVDSNVGELDLYNNDPFPFNNIIQGNLNNNFDTTNYTYTVNVQGRYMVTLTYTIQIGSNGTPVFVLNGNHILKAATMAGSTGPQCSVLVYDMMPGDILQIQQGGPHTHYNFAPTYCMLTVDLI